MLGCEGRTPPNYKRNENNMNATNKSVEEVYMEMATQEFAKKANDEIIADYVKNAYAASKHLLFRKDMSIQEFAAYTSNWNPNKSGIGEKAQLEVLRKKFPNIEKLPSHGKNSISLTGLPGGQYGIVRGRKSNLAGVKSFDMMDSDQKEVRFFVAKTIDIGFLTDSTGGGHQTNVLDELINFLSFATCQKLSFAGKSVKIYLAVDGRSADAVIAAGRKLTQGCAYIVIDKSENL